MPTEPDSDDTEGPAKLEKPKYRSKTEGDVSDKVKPPGLAKSQHSADSRRHLGKRPEYARD